MEYFYTAILIISIYVVKYLLVVKHYKPLISTIYFFATIAIAVPFIYIFIVDWNETFNIDPLAQWVGTPIIILFIPVVTFIYDIIKNKSKIPKKIVACYIIEIVLFPVWAYFWIFVVEGMFLDWWWL